MWFKLYQGMKWAYKWDDTIIPENKIKQFPAKHATATEAPFGDDTHNEGSPLQPVSPPSNPTPSPCNPLAGKRSMLPATRRA